MKGPDYLGLTRELLAQLIKTNENMYQKFANLLVNGRVPPRTLALLLNDRRVALLKPDSERFRPVSLRPHLILPVEQHLSAGLNEKTRRVTAPQQMGVGHRTGVEDVYHTVLNALQNDDVAVVRMDCANAYGNISRAAILRAVRQHHPAALPYVSAMFRHSGSGIAQGSDGIIAFIANMDGVPQGSSMSSALFCLALDIAIKATAAEHPGVIITAIADDIFIIGRVPDLKKAIDTMTGNLSELFLPVNDDKTTYFSRNADTQTAIQTLIDQGQLQGSVKAEGIVIAGIPIANNHAFTAQALSNRIHDTAQLIARVVHLPPQLAYRVYRCCIQTKWDHIWRSGVIEGSSNQHIIDRLQRLQSIFTEYLTNMPEEAWYTDTLRAIRLRAIEAPPSQGGIGIALVPHRRVRIAGAVGTY